MQSSRKFFKREKSFIVTIFSQKNKKKSKKQIKDFAESFKKFILSLRNSFTFAFKKRREIKFLLFSKQFKVKITLIKRVLRKKTNVNSRYENDKHLFLKIFKKLRFVKTLFSNFVLNRIYDFIDLFMNDIYENGIETNDWILKIKTHELIAAIVNFKMIIHNQQIILKIYYFKNVKIFIINHCDSNDFVFVNVIKNIFKKLVFWMKYYSWQDTKLKTRMIIFDKNSSCFKFEVFTQRVKNFNSVFNVKFRAMNFSLDQCHCCRHEDHFSNHCSNFITIMFHEKQSLNFLLRNRSTLLWEI